MSSHQEITPYSFILNELGLLKSTVTPSEKEGAFALLRKFVVNEIHDVTAHLTGGEGSDIELAAKEAQRVLRKAKDEINQVIEGINVAVSEGKTSRAQLVEAANYAYYQGEANLTQASLDQPRGDGLADFIAHVLHHEPIARLTVLDRETAQISPAEVLQWNMTNLLSYASNQMEKMAARAEGLCQQEAKNMRAS